jgi:hypothetical protein
MTTFQGHPCGQGHDGLRYTANGKCVWCIREAKQRYREREVMDRVPIEHPDPPSSPVPGNLWFGNPNDFADDDRRAHSLADSRRISLPAWV